VSAPHIALVSARGARKLDEDLPPLRLALEAAGARVTIARWDDPKIEWPDFDLALLRSTWDYAQRLPEFLDWVHRAALHTRLLNPLAVVRWNTDKHYLAELARAGVPVVPSAFVEPGKDAQAALSAFLESCPHAEDVVIKPSVGAGSKDAQRHARASRGEMLAHLDRLLDAGRSALMQPYLPNVDTHGETALLFFDGEYSHAIRKGPLLKRGAEAARGLFAKEEITARTPSSTEREVARRALEAIPFGRPLLYARVDLIHNESGAPRLLELELTEPSVFLAHAEGAAERFAQAILGRVR
jgi:glutathione synthase/RimK-type ligase-like ATP-grasp enzyme